MNWLTIIGVTASAGLLFWNTNQVEFIYIYPVTILLVAFVWLNGYVNGIYLDAKKTKEEFETRYNTAIDNLDKTKK